MEQKGFWLRSDVPGMYFSSTKHVSYSLSLTVLKMMIKCVFAYFLSERV